MMLTLIIQLNVQLAILFAHMICENSIADPRIIHEVFHILSYIIYEVPCES